MNSDNPYQFSASEIDPDLLRDTANQETADLLARLGAYVVDMLFIFIPIVAIVALAGVSLRNLESFESMGTALLIGGVWLLIAVVIQSAQVANHSATIGKRALGIKMVRTDGSNVTWARWFFLRQGVVGLISQIPVAGGIFALVDILVIFGAERRCIHDLIADTRVVKA